MELVQGVSITEYCDRNSLSTKDRLGLFIQVCNAVQHAHQKGIIHRDIKPSNIMVTHHDGKPVPKVIDFGIAKAINQKLTEKTLFTRYAHLIGTPAYMSPEQAELSDLDIDTRTDIYSLGVLLYELLTGTTPFSEEELRKAGYVEMQRVIREQEPVKPSTKISTLGDTSTEIAKRRSSTPELLRKAIRGDLDWIVMKSLEKDRSHRYETANDLAEDLRRHLEHEPVLARGPNTIYRLHKFFHRHRAQVLVAAMIVVVVVAAGGILSLWNRDRQRLDQVRELQERGVLSQAREQYAAGDRQAALKTITPALSSRDVGSEAQLLYAGILVEGRLPNQAGAMLKQLIRDRPEIAGAAYALLARLIWESEVLDGEKQKEMEEYRRRAEALLPGTAEAHFLRAMIAVTVKEQLAWLDKALRLDPGHYDSRRLRALTYQASRKYEEMEHDALVMTVLNKDDPLGYSLRATAWRELGRYQEALTDYDRALDLTPGGNPQYIDLSVQRCETFMRMEDYDQVVSESQACSQLWADRPIFQYLGFCALTALGDYDKATVLFHRIVNTGPDARRQLDNWCAKHVFDALEAKRPWHPPQHEPVGAPFLTMIEAQECHRTLSAKAYRVVKDAFMGQWSPDGKKLAFSLGRQGYNGMALFDPATKETELLIVCGKYPTWSPDGRYLAFVRDRRFLRLPDLAAAQYGGRPWPDFDEEEVWVMQSDGTKPRRLARGNSPSWSQDSTCVYYWSLAEKAICSISVIDPNARARQLTACSNGFSAVSPDGERVAYLQGASLIVKDLTQIQLAEWPAPYGTVGGPTWSSKGDELCMASDGRLENRTGLWIYGLDKSDPAQILGGPITGASWSAGGERLVFDLGEPYVEMWTADLDPNLSVIEALGPARTLEQHFREMVALYTRRIETDPLDAHACFLRAQHYDRLYDRENADADMKRWLAVTSGKSPLEVAPTRVDFAFGELENLDAAIPFLNDAIIECLSADGREMFICSSRPGGCGDCDIWVLHRVSTYKDWEPPENPGSPVNSAAGDAASCLSADGLELYFNSNRPGGHGNYDLYVTRRASHGSPWGQIENLGPEVNTVRCEAFPQVLADGLELYFQSARPGGYGRFDLYVSRRATSRDRWSAPENLGPGVNSPCDDACPSLSADGLLLFFSDYVTPRSGGHGNDDLWMTRRASRFAPWEPPVNLGPKVNGPLFDLRPYLAPDGSALYFLRKSGDVLTHWKVPIIPTLDSELNGKANELEQEHHDRANQSAVLVNLN
jgi:tetratricopeptide (TPR) repeat protein